MASQKNHETHLRGNYEKPGGATDVASQSLGAIQTVGDAITPFVPLFNMVTNILNQMLQIYENAKCNDKICAALLERVEIAQTAVKSLQRKYQANEKKFRNQDYYYAWVRFVNVLENIRKFAKEVTQLTYFQKFINANAVKDAFEKNIKEFEEVCSDLNFTMALYNAEQREMEAQNVAEDLEILKKSMNDMKDEITELRFAITEVTTLITSANVLGSQINDAQSKGADIHMDKSGPLIEAYKAPRVDPSELQDPFSSDDNVRGTNNTVRKKIYRGIDVACKKVQLVKPNEGTRNLDKAMNKKQQIELAALLKLGVCPFIINFYGVSNVDNSEVMIYDWAAYSNLRDVYKKYDIDWPTKLRFARDIFNGLVFMHQCSLYHHDVRCENIVVTDRFEPKISNFELSRTLTGVSAEIKILADIIRWLAPEKMRKAPKGSTQRYNHQCEMYSFGMMLWELCHQRFPYNGMDIGEIQEHVLNKKREVLEHTLSPSPIQKELYKLIKRAWEDEPSARPSDIEMQQKLKDLFQEHVFCKGISPHITPKKVYNDVPKLDLSRSFQDKVNISTDSNKQFEAPDDCEELCLDNITIPMIQPLIPFEDGIKAHKAKEYKKAWECFEGHAKLGNNMAKYWQGYYLLNGTGVKKDHTEALRLFKEAADAGVPDAQLRYAFALLENKINLDVPEILKYMTMAADSENSTALFNLGDIYWNGKLGVEIDKAKAESYIKLAALKNQPKAIPFLEKIKAEKANIKFI
ncbi:kinase-like protein [Gigaspora margarita]|uniref:Kinase-like protein n=1 Tax=Gigaspora margarita TaxID=4874 RepID=A0A8H4A4A6_GIGMA|nr:kinase-like protein [Gigaspora margarita]